MKICYFFPVFKDNDAKSFFEEFSKSSFFAKYPDRQIIFACEQSDSKNLDYLTTLADISTVNVFESNFSYLDAFASCLPNFDGDVLLLGDTSLCDNSLVFEKCMEEHSLGADVVHICKSYTGVKGFFARIWSKCFNVFSNLISNKNDSGNVLSLGLYSRDVVEIMQALPDKSCLLKNTTSLLGVEYKTIYIDSSSETYTPNYHSPSPSLTKSIISSSVFLLAIILTTLFCTFLPNYQLPIILIGIFIIIVSACTGLMMLFKHFFDLRNTANILTYKQYVQNGKSNKTNKKSKTPTYKNKKLKINKEKLSTSKKISKDNNKKLNKMTEKIKKTKKIQNKTSIHSTTKQIKEG